MMKKILMIVCCLLAAVLGVKAQKVRVGIQTGVSQYQLDDLKDINQSIQNAILFDTKIVANFPSFVYFQPSVVLENNRWNYGAYYSFYSTGSRISATDYSASYLFDTRIRAHTIGLTNEYYFLKYRGFKMGAYSNIGLSMTTYQTKDSFTVLDSVLNRRVDQKYTGYSVVEEPGLMISIPYQSFHFTLNAGYSFQLTGNGLTNAKNDKRKLQNPLTGKEAKVQWNGYKVGLALYYSFNKGNKDKE